MIDFQKDHYDLYDFKNLMAILRGPGGCPWDREQNHQSIRRNMLEEAYEVCEAIDEADSAHLREELGDVLMQVLFHSQMEEEAGNFDVDDVADEACRKLIRRHPHVFSDTKVRDSGDVLSNWDEIKRIEKSQVTASSAMDSVAKSLPALWRAEKIQSKAGKLGFDWPDVGGALEKISEESAELTHAISAGAGIEEELGDLLFSVVNVSRFVDVDPEQALHAACEKFTRRFKYIETGAADLGKDFDEMSLGEMESLYREAKALEGTLE